MAQADWFDSRVGDLLWAGPLAGWYVGAVGRGLTKVSIVASRDASRVEV